MSLATRVHRTTPDHLRCLENRAAYLREISATRAQAGQPAGYEKQQEHAIREALQEIRESRAAIESLLRKLDRLEVPVD